MRRPLIAGNWKMNGSIDSISQLLSNIKLGFSELSKIDCVVFSPFPYLAQCQAALSGTGLFWGAQDVSNHLSGAYTGDVSVPMIKDFACSHVLVGHSERRHGLGESDQTVAKKYFAAASAQISPILCLGETQAQRASEETLSVVEKQLHSVLDLANSEDDLKDMVIAYEPVWAIGTGAVASPDQVQQVHKQIREIVRAKSSYLAESVRVIYGGSVNPENAAGLLGCTDVDGALIGGVSLIAEQFLKVGMLCNSSC